MVKIHPDLRYSSFSDIMSDITAGVLSEINFTDEQKTCYRNFADTLCSHIYHYKNNYIPVNDVGQTLSKLAELIRNSSLEQFIQNNSQLIGCFIMGGYTYNGRKDIKLQLITDFYSLATSLSPAKRKLIFANIYTRLATIKIVMDDPDLPF